MEISDKKLYDNERTTEDIESLLDKLHVLQSPKSYHKITIEKHNQAKKVLATKVESAARRLSNELNLSNQSGKRLFENTKRAALGTYNAISSFVQYGNFSVDFEGFKTENDRIKVQFVTIIEDKDIDLKKVYSIYSLNYLNNLYELLIVPEELRGIVENSNSVDVSDALNELILSMFRSKTQEQLLMQVINKSKQVRGNLYEASLEKRDLEDKSLNIELIVDQCVINYKIVISE